MEPESTKIEDIECDLNKNNKTHQKSLLGNESCVDSEAVPSESWPRPNSAASRVTFNIGGVIFQTVEDTLKNVGDENFKPSDPNFLRRFYDADKQEYFFDRDPEVFRSVLNYCRTGSLHLPANMCGPSIKYELEFWGLTEINIQPCCWSNFHSWMETTKSLEQLEIDRNPEYMQPPSPKTASMSKANRVRNFVWKSLTDPAFSTFSKVYAYVSLFFVVLAIFSFCASTHKLFQISREETDSISDSTLNGSTNATAKPDEQKSTGTLRNKRVHVGLIIIDVICLVFFTLEYLIRFCCAPRPCKFVRSFIAVIDLLAILPDYVELIVFAVHPDISTPYSFMEFMPFLRLMRAFRIFRLIRRVPGLWIMMYTLKASFKELSLMLMFLLVGTLLFSSIVFFVDDTDVFISIPHGFWWAIVTMTTVGYGDMTPRTVWGQIVGSVTAICGVLIIGFTIPALVNNFITYYNHIQFVLQKEYLYNEAKKVATDQDTVNGNKLRKKTESDDFLPIKEIAVTHL